MVRRSRVRERGRVREEVQWASKLRLEEEVAGDG